VFKQKQYLATSKIRYAFMKYNSLVKLAEMYVKHDKHDRAKQTMEEAMQKEIKAWELVHEIYPKLKGKKLTFSHYDKKITVDEQ